MYSALDIERCPHCKGLTKPVNSDGLGQGYSCIQHCTQHCQYVFHYIPNKDTLAVEKFIFTGGKLVVKHYTRQTEYYQLVETLPGFTKFELVTTRLGTMKDVTPETALSILNRELKINILR